MGYYINHTPTIGTLKSSQKAKQLMDSKEAELLLLPQLPSTLPAGKGLVCVIENGPFDAAAYCYSDAEYNYFNADESGRNKTWLTMDKDLVEKLSNYKQ